MNQTETIVAQREAATSLPADTTGQIPYANAGVVPEEFRVDVSGGGYESAYTPGDTMGIASLAEAVVGKETDPLPYRLPSDNALVVCVFFCFFLLSYVLSNGKRYLAQQVKDLFSVRERSSLFAVETGADVRYRLLLVVQTCLLLALFFFDYSHDSFPELFPVYPSLWVLGCYVGIILLFYLLKMLLYTFVDWIFFDKQKNSLWLESYSLLFSLFGILLFPLLLLVVFFDLSDLNSLIFFAILVVLGGIMLLYKCFNIFFNRKYGYFYFIVYFCALEMVPCFLLWEALITTNNLLIIKN